MFPLLILPDKLAKATIELIAKARDAMKDRHYDYIIVHIETFSFT